MLQQSHPRQFSLLSPYIDRNFRVKPYKALLKATFVVLLQIYWLRTNMTLSKDDINQDSSVEASFRIRSILSETHDLCSNTEQTLAKQSDQLARIENTVDRGNEHAKQSKRLIQDLKKLTNRFFFIPVWTRNNKKIDVVHDVHVATNDTHKVVHVIPNEIPIKLSLANPPNLRDPDSFIEDNLQIASLQLSALKKRAEIIHDELSEQVEHLSTINAKSTELHENVVKVDRLLKKI